MILGGDIAFSLIHREASPDEMRFFQSKGRVGTVASMRAMVRQSDSDKAALVELKAVDPSYPHGGVLKLADGSPHGERLMAAKDGVFGALVAPEFLDRLGVHTGDRVRLGDETLQVRGVIGFEPDRLSSGVGFGPRFLVSIDALKASGLLRPGSLVTWTYRIRMPDQANGLDRIGALRAEADRLFPEAGWSVRSRDDAAPGLKRNIERFSQFLTLVGLTALIVGGVGVANAVSSFVDLKRPAIATLKCLGARNAVIFQVYLIQILMLALLGIAIGLVVGALIPFAAKAALAQLVPVSAVRVYPLELGFAVVYGLLVTLGFSLGPLGRAEQLPAASLFADRAVHAPQKPPLRYRAAQAVALLALAGLAVRLAGDRQLSLFYIGSVIGSFIVLRVVASAIMAAARRFGSVRGTALRLAVRNVHRPGALTPSVVLSLGLGLTLLVSLALIDTNLRDQLAGAVTAKAPDFFFIDVQDSERDAFVSLLDKTVPGGKVETAPMLRGRIAAVNGTPVIALTGRKAKTWALRGDRGLTYADSVPANSTLVAGKWWPAGYDGEPLVSLDREIAQDLGLAIGDTITVNVLGRDVTARIANLRQLDWDSLSINFVLVFSPNTLSWRAAHGRAHAKASTRRRPRRRARRPCRGHAGLSGRHLDQRPRRDPIDQRRHLRSHSCRARGGVARARRIDAGARRGACGRTSPATTGRRHPENARRDTAGASLGVLARIRHSRHRDRALRGRRRDGGGLVRRHADHGASIHRLSAGRGDGRGDGARDHARARARRNLAHPLGEARAAAQEPLTKWALKSRKIGAFRPPRLVSGGQDRHIPA